MKTLPGLLAVLLVSAAVAVAQTTPPARSTNPAPRTGQGKDARTAGPDPDLFDGTKFEKENRPETGMIGEFEMPGSNESQDSKVGGNPSQAGGGQPPPKNSPAGAAGAQTPPAGPAGASAAAAGSEGGGSGSDAAAASEGSGSAGAVGGALDQSKPMGNSGQSSAGGPNAKAEGTAASQLQGGGAAASAAAQSAASQGNKQKSSANKIGSAELRIDPLPETEKDVIGREAAPAGTQGSNRAMPAGNGAQGSTNQNKGVEKGKVMPKGL